MKALALVDGFGFDRLRWIDRPVPKPGSGEILLRIKAASLNYRDIEVVTGKRKLALPLVPLSDACGVIEAVGADVTSFAVGDRALPCFVQGWLDGAMPPEDVLPTLGGPLDGVACEYGVWPESGLVRAPAHLSDVESATLPCAAVSAWTALFVMGSVKPGQTVLVQGTGGVALFALQLAKLAGARVIVTSSDDAKLERARTLGADHGINYVREPAWGRTVRALVPSGVDCVVEVGGQHTLAQSMIAARNGGCISYVGSLSGSAASFDLGDLSRKAVRISGVRVGHRASFEAMCRAVAASGLKPVIDSVFPFRDAPEALRRFQAGHFGKVCIAYDDAAEGR